MSLNSDPNQDRGDFLDLVDSHVAREHWEAITRLAAWQGGILLGIGALMGLSPVQALGITHLVSTMTALLQGVFAMRMESAGQEESATDLARRSLAALLLAGITLLAMLLAGR